MEQWDIRKLDCSKMMIDPQHPQLVNFLESNIPKLKAIKTKYKTKVFTKNMVYRYMLLLYDKNSEIQSMQNLSWFGKKYEACGYAGFKLSKNTTGKPRFDKMVDEMVMGKNKSVNDMIVEFIAWSCSQQWRYNIFLEESMLNLSRDALGRKITKASASQDYMKLYRDSVSTINEMAHVFEETEDFYDRFYYKIAEARGAVTPEDYATALANGDKFEEDCPYGVKYSREHVLDRISFLGDDEELLDEQNEE